MVETLELILNAVQDAKRLPHWWKRGVLTLLYKKGDPTEIRNYRPLSIMGSDYRLYTALLSERLVRAFEMVIADHQVAFLPKRQIGDNIKLVQCVIDKYRNSEKEVEVLFLDQEKVYDRVSHAYLWECLRAFGVPRRFIHRVKALYVEGTLVPYMNGHKGEEIMVRCGVRQGDSLLCLLFNICIEPFAMTVKSNLNLRGIDLPRGNVVKLVLYPDDVTLFLRSISEIVIIAGILQRFERASGGKVNWVKSWFLALGTMRTDQLPIQAQVLPLGEAYTHLGIPMGVNVGSAVKRFFDEMINQIGKDVERWINARLFQRARLRVANTLMMSVPRFAINHLLLSKKNEDRLERLQQKLV